GVRAACHRAAGSRGYGEVGAIRIVPREDAEEIGAGDVAVGRDGERAAAVVAQAHALAVAGDRAAGSGDHGEIGAVGAVVGGDAVVDRGDYVAACGNAQGAVAVVVGKNAVRV